MTVKFRAAASAKSKDRLTLDQRLRLHQRVQPMIAWANRNSYLFTAAPTVSMIPAFFADRHSRSLWPFLLPGLLAIYIAVLAASYRIWRANIVKIAAFDDIAAVAPLLDFADTTFLSLHNTSEKPMPLSESVVLPYLPDLLARMPAGDGPTLTASQRSALVRMVCSPLYEKHFRAPGLRAKIDAMTKKR